jgi:hypothetical protein
MVIDQIYHGKCESAGSVKYGLAGSPRRRRGGLRRDAANNPTISTTHDKSLPDPVEARQRALTRDGAAGRSDVLISGMLA